MSNLIDRQQAIDAIHCDITVTGRQNAELVAATIGTFADRIKALPSAQPEIIRCKDCKHRWTHKCMDSMPIERCDLGQTFYDAEVDYCSLAERREVTT